jgi:superfamily II DNA or RNA helicase
MVHFIHPAPEEPAGGKKGVAMNVSLLMNSARVEPRPYQQRIVAKAVDCFCTRGLRSVLIDSPTGSGKTVMALLIAQTLQDRLGVRVGWVAMRRHLLAQAAAENRTRELGVEAAFISMFDRSPPAGLDLLVVDEAQHDAAGSMAHIHNVIRPRFILGLSATPFRADRIKLCFDTVLRDAGIAPLIQDGYLSRYHHYTIPAYTPRAVADLYAREPRRWGKSIMYFHTLDQCGEARAALEAHGVRCDVVTGSSDREAQLEAFEAGRVAVLINCLVLGEGFDCPDLQTVFCRPSAKGVTIQMCGRVLRRCPNLPFKQIVQCQKTRWPFPRTAAAAQQYTWVEGDWRTLEVNPRINALNCAMLQALARIEVQLPPCLQQQRPSRRWQEERFGRREEG